MLSRSDSWGVLIEFERRWEAETGIMFFFCAEERLGVSSFALAAEGNEDLPPFEEIELVVLELAVGAGTLLGMSVEEDGDMKTTLESPCVGNVGGRMVGFDEVIKNQLDAAYPARRSSLSWSPVFGARRM